jgi:hypothetical protein
MEQPSIYTRDQLKGMKEEVERQQYLRNLNDYINRIRSAILSTARSSTQTNYFAKYQVADGDEKQMTFIKDVIDKLKEEFIDVSIEYKSQTDIRTGKKFNEGLYIDWS